jgi:hypothetical protein
MANTRRPHPRHHPHRLPHIAIPGRQAVPIPSARLQNSLLSQQPGWESQDGSQSRCGHPPGCLMRKRPTRLVRWTRCPPARCRRPASPAARLWADLDKPWQEAFRQAWEALRSGNIAVGACASTADAEIVHSARNRVSDTEGPPGEIFGSALAHAETNLLALLPFHRHRDLVLTTTLQPCPDDNAPAVPAVRGCHPARPCRNRAVRGAGPLLGRMPRLR